MVAVKGGSNGGGSIGGGSLTGCSNGFAATEAAATEAAEMEAAAATEATSMTASQQQRWCLAMMLEKTQQQGKKINSNQPVAKVITLASHSGGSVIVSTAPSEYKYCYSKQQ